jgi:hypothetical protein
MNHILNQYNFFHYIAYPLQKTAIFSMFFKKIRNKCIQKMFTMLLQLKQPLTNFYTKDTYILTHQ